MSVFDAKEVQLLAINAALRALDFDMVGTSNADDEVDDARHWLLQAREKLTDTALPEGLPPTDAEMQAFIEQQRAEQTEKGWL